MNRASKNFNGSLFEKLQQFLDDEYYNGIAVYTTSSYTMGGFKILDLIAFKKHFLATILGKSLDWFERYIRRYGFKQYPYKSNNWESHLVLFAQDIHFNASEAARGVNMCLVLGSEGWDGTASPTEVLFNRVPAYVQSLFGERLRGGRLL